MKQSNDEHEGTYPISKRNDFLIIQKTVAVYNVFCAVKLPRLDLWKLFE